jgi:hypothetical protein
VLLKTWGVPQCDLAIYILNKSIFKAKEELNMETQIFHHEKKI